MKKNIAIVVLLIVTACSFIYAYTKANETESLIKELRDTQELASNNKAMAREQEMKALDAAAEATKQAAIARDQAAIAREMKEQLENCKRG